MKDAILLELAARWEEDAKPNGMVEDGSPENAENRFRNAGMRETKRECADTIRTLVKIMGNGAA